MKHVAKHQKRAQVTAQTAVATENGKGKTKKVKNPILQTYFTSLFSLILCVSMFFGTSLAWFSSEVQNTGNQIMIGTLEAELWMGDESLSGEGAETKVFDNTIKWEPGYTALRALTVKNTGELDFTYTLTLTALDAALTEEEIAIARNFEVYSKVDDCTGESDKPKDYAELTAEWEPVMVNMDKQATLEDVLTYGLTVFRGSVDTADDSDEQTFTIALHMKDGAESGEGTSAIMGKTLELNVKLVAYQKTTGAGDLTNAASDAGTFVSTYVDLQKALGDGGTVILAKDLVLDKALELPAEKNVTLDLNGHKLMTSGFDVSGKLIVVDSRTGGTISAGVDWNSVFQIQNGGSIVLENGMLSGTNAIRFLGDGSFTMNGGEIASTGHAMVVGDSANSAVTADVDLNSGKIAVGNSSYVVCVENGSFTAETDTEVTIEYGEGAKFDNVTSNTAETETETESETETETETETEGAEGTEPVDTSESE